MVRNNLRYWEDPEGPRTLSQEWNKYLKLRYLIAPSWSQLHLTRQWTDLCVVSNENKYESREG